VPKSMPFCPDCGAKLLPTDHTCMNCGADIGGRQKALVNRLLQRLDRPADQAAKPVLCAERPSPSPHTRGPLPRWAGVLIAGVTIGALLLALIVGRSRGGLQVTLFDEEVYDAPIKTQVVRKLLVGGRFSKRDLEEMVREQYRSVRARRDFNYHNPANTVAIYAYTDQARAQAGDVWVAALIKTADDREPTVMVDEGQLAQIGRPPEVKYGLTEEQRQQVWLGIVAAEDRAHAEAEATYPLPDPATSEYRQWSRDQLDQQRNRQGHLVDQLQLQYKDDLARQYGLTQEQLVAIGTEGFQKRWPIPPLP